MIWTLLSVAVAGPPAIEAVTYHLPMCDPLLDNATSRQLSRLRTQDERDRIRGNDRTAKHDAERVATVQRLVDEDRVCTPRDHFNAAVILQRGTSPQDQLQAHVFAFHALANGIRKADRLTAITYDRWLVSRGMPQWYGTQTGTDVHDRACLIEIDPEARDSERIAVGLPPLTEIVAETVDPERRGESPVLGVNGLYCPAVAWDDPKNSPAMPSSAALQQ